MISAKLTELFHTNKKQDCVDKKIKDNKKLIKQINNLIDELIKNSRFETYHLEDMENNIYFKFSYETNVYGESPRYEIEGKQYDKTSYKWYTLVFRYYYGKINKFVEPMKSVEVDEFDIHGDLSKVIELIENENVSRKVNKYCKKIRSLIRIE